MQVRTDDAGAVRGAWSAYEHWLAARLGDLDDSGVLSIELAREMTEDGLVPSVDVYVEGDGRLSVSATGNGMLGEQFRMRPEFKSELGRTWTPHMLNDRGVVLWRLEASRSESASLAAAVCRVLGAGFRVPHPVWLVTRADGRLLEAPDWRTFHRGHRTAG